MFCMYAAFVCLVLLLLALDLGVFHRQAHVVSIKEALGWSAFWVALGLAFGAFIYFGYEKHWLGLGLTPDMMTVAPQAVEGLGTVYNDGSPATVKYITGYLVEKSLAVDNIFVIAMIFAFFAVPALYQHRVLFWGIIDALVMRGAMIAAGTQLIREFTWIIYIFGMPFFACKWGKEFVFHESDYANGQYLLSDCDMRDSVEDRSRQWANT